MFGNKNVDTVMTNDEKVEALNRAAKISMIANGVMFVGICLLSFTTIRNGKKAKQAEQAAPAQQ